MKSSHLRSIALTLGAATLLTLSVPSVLAGLDGGRFFVHAENVQEPQYEATAGIGGELKGGGGGEIPGAAALQTFSCGSIATPITQAMVDFSEANLSKFNGDPSAALTPYPGSGWTILSANAYKPGGWSVGSSSITFHGGPNGSGGLRSIGSYQISGDGCQYLNLAQTPADGVVYSYAEYDDGFRSEGRYLMEDGKLIRAEASPDESTRYAQDGSNYRGDRPYHISYSGNEPTRYDYTDLQGGKYKSVEATPANEQYGELEEYRIVQRDPKAGPSYVKFDAAGNITNLGYTGPNGEEEYFNSRFDDLSNADVYNERTGSNWDYTLPRLSTLDKSAPFEFAR